MRARRKKEDLWVDCVHGLVANAKPNAATHRLLVLIKATLADCLYDIDRYALLLTIWSIRFTAKGSAIERAVACVAASHVTRGDRLDGAVLRQAVPISDSSARQVLITRTELALLLIQRKIAVKHQILSIFDTQLSL